MAQPARPWNAFTTLGITPSDFCIANDAHAACRKNLSVPVALEKNRTLEDLGQRDRRTITPGDVREVLKKCSCGPHQAILDQLVPVYHAKI
jgi:hypothetical protein